MRAYEIWQVAAGRAAVAVERTREAARPLPAQGSGNLTRDPKGRTGRAAGDGRPDQNFGTFLLWDFYAAPN